jgi:hypothetical protein
MHMPPPSAEAMDKAIKLGHEPSAISVKGVIWFLIIMVLTIAATFAFVWVVWRFLVDDLAKTDLPRSSVASLKVTPANPQLQPSKGIHEHMEHEDLNAMHDSENQRFSQMGWMQPDGNVQVSANIADQVMQMSKVKGAPTSSSYAGWGSAATTSK